MKQTKSNSLKQNQKLAKKVAESYPYKKGFYFFDPEICRNKSTDMAGIFAFLMDKHIRYFLENKLDSDGFFPLKHSEITKATRIKEYTIRKCKKTLKNEGILETKMKGFPPVEYYRMLKGGF